MLRESTQHLSGELDYLTVRPMLVQYTQEPDDIRQLPAGYVIPGEIAEAWPSRAVNNLIWVGKLVPVPRGSVEGNVTVDAPERTEPPAVESAAEAFELVPLGGGFFELSDGSRVRGRNKALAAQAQLDAAAAETDA